MSVTIAFERLKKLKEEKGVSIKEISEATKISKYTLKKYFTEEESLERMNQTNIYLLCKYFNVPADYLIGLSDIRDWTFVCPDGEQFAPTYSQAILPSYSDACKEFVEYLVKNKGYSIKEIK